MTDKYPPLGHKCDRCEVELLHMHPYRGQIIIKDKDVQTKIAHRLCRVCADHLYPPRYGNE